MTATIDRHPLLVLVTTSEVSGPDRGALRDIVNKALQDLREAVATTLGRDRGSND